MTETQDNTETKAVLQSTVPESYVPIVKQFASDNDWSLAKAGGKLIEFALLQKGLLSDQPPAKNDKAKTRRTG